MSQTVIGRLCGATLANQARLTLQPRRPVIMQQYVMRSAKKDRIKVSMCANQCRALQYQTYGDGQECVNKNGQENVCVKGKMIF